MLYAHRDSGFKALWDIKIGDILEVRTCKSTKEYKVNNIYVTNPKDEKIFNQTDETKLTLVTCYPFVYSGPANERCVVECVLK